MKIIKNQLNIVNIMLFVMANFLFYKSIFSNYPNIYLTSISLFLLITETIFWISMTNNVVNEKKLLLKEKEKKIIKYLFLTAIIGVGVSRVILYSSPYFNDLLNVNIFLLYFVGLMRLLLIFNSVLFIVLAINIKKISYIIISILNIVISVMIWLEFDMDITSVLRVIVSIFYIYIIYMTNRKGDKNEILK